MSKSGTLMRSRRGTASVVLLLFMASIFLIVAIAYRGLKIRPEAKRNAHSKTTVYGKIIEA